MQSELQKIGKEANDSLDSRLRRTDMLNKKNKKEQKNYKMYEAKKTMTKLNIERELLLNTVVY